MSVASDRVRSTVIEATEFPELSRAYQVMGVPKVVINDRDLLPVLDWEEGYNFERRRAIVTLANGRRARAWVYRYRGPQNRAVPIPDGDYRRVHPRPATGVRAAGRRGAGAPPAEAR